MAVMIRLNQRTTRSGWATSRRHLIATGLRKEIPQWAQNWAHSRRGERGNSMPGENGYAQFMRTASVLFLLLVALALLAAAANAQDSAKSFRCPDGTVVSLETKGRPYRCPDSDAQRAENAAAAQAATHTKEQDERWQKRLRDYKAQVARASRTATAAATPKTGAVLGRIFLITKAGDIKPARFAKIFLFEIKATDSAGQTADPHWDFKSLKRGLHRKIFANHLQ